METQTGDVQPVTISDLLGLATWSRERSNDELRQFIDKKHAAVDTTDLLSELDVVG
jgi:hypothetical protein